MLAGVVSGGGRVCGQPRVPSIYTRVAQYAEWLKVGELTAIIPLLNGNLLGGDTGESNPLIELGWNLCAVI